MQQRRQRGERERQRASVFSETYLERIFTRPLTWVAPFYISPVRSLRSRPSRDHRSSYTPVQGLVRRSGQLADVLACAAVSLSLGGLLPAAASAQLSTPRAALVRVPLDSAPFRARRLELVQFLRLAERFPPSTRGA